MFFSAAFAKSPIWGYGERVLAGVYLHPDAGTRAGARRLHAAHPKARQPWDVPIARRSICSRPVSYTHLDVYKRQLEGSVETAGSMSARGYGVGRRTTYRPYRLTRRDIVLLTVQVTLVVMILFAGIPQARFTPILAIAPVSWGFAAYCLFLLMPFVLWIEGELRWLSLIHI